jgi:hypothetical protein
MARASGLSEGRVATPGHRMSHLLQHAGEYVQNTRFGAHWRVRNHKQGLVENRSRNSAPAGNRAWSERLTDVAY